MCFMASSCAALRRLSSGKVLALEFDVYTMATRPGVVYHEGGKTVSHTHSQDRDRTALHWIVMDESDVCGEP